MTGFRELVAIALVECLMPLGFPRQAQAMAAAERGEAVRQKVEQLGTGAAVFVLVTLRGQEETLRGTVESYDDTSFRLRPERTGDPRTVRYVDVTALGLTKRTYRAERSNASDPVTVRRVAVELGVGRKVQVRTQDRNTLVGRIAKLDAEQLYVKIGEGGPVSVSYAQVRELKLKKMHVAAKLGIAVGVLFAGLVSLFVLGGGLG